MDRNNLGRLLLPVLGLVLVVATVFALSPRALTREASAAPAPQATNPTPTPSGPFGPGGMMGPGFQAPQGTPGPSQPFWGPGGMMGPGGWGGANGWAGPNWGQGGFGPGGMMGGMAGMMGGPYPSTAKPISSADAASLVDKYLQSLGNSDLAFDELHSFAYNFYAPVYEKSTKNFAFELIVDRFGGGVVPEMGPNMAWNSKYGMMAGSMMGSWGMMGGWWNNQGQQGAQQSPTVDTPTTRDQAIGHAQTFLDSFMPGTKAGEVHDFYGYRTVDVERDGKMVGMLSVNGYNGAVWYHTWHGDFLEDWTR